MYYALINSDSIEVKKTTKLLSLKEMQSLVGIPGKKAYMEACYGNYTDKSIVILCDDDSLRKHCLPTCLMNNQSTVLQGQLLVLRLDRQNENYGLLTQKQVEIVKRETQLWSKVLI